MSSTSVGGLQQSLMIAGGCDVGGPLPQHEGVGGWGIVDFTDLQQPDGFGGGGGCVTLLQLQTESDGGGTIDLLQQPDGCGGATITFDLQQPFCGDRGGGGVGGLNLFPQQLVSSISGGLLIEQQPDDDCRLLTVLQQSDTGGDGVGGGGWAVCFKLALLQQGWDDDSPRGVDIGDGRTNREGCNGGDKIGLMLDSWELVDFGRHGLSGPQPPWQPSNGSHWQFSHRQMPASAVIS